MALTVLGVLIMGGLVVANKISTADARTTPEDEAVAASGAGQPKFYQSDESPAPFGPMPAGSMARSS